MGKLNLAIVDKDAEYVRCLQDYLMTEYAYKFTVNAYTEETDIYRFLAEMGKIASCEVILVTYEFYEQIKNKCNNLVILLADQEGIYKPSERKIINKYQYGDRIATEIIKIYTEEISGKEGVYPLCSFISNKSTKIIGVYSPLGGVGKTTITVGACIQSVWEGKNVFYLNLENIPTTSLYFRGEQDKNLTNVLYYLKSKRDNLFLQIESCKCFDPYYKIHYFKPPDSVLDFHENISQELCCLLQELKASKQYDRIFVDFSSEINKNNLAVLRACDSLVLVAQNNKTSEIKLQGMCKEIRLLFSPAEGEELLEKFNLVLNNEISGAVGKDEEQTRQAIMINNKGVLGKIPFVKDLATEYEGIYRLDFNSGFGKAIHRLLRKLS